MPLYKRTLLQPLELPEALEPNELVFQVRFTKEIFRDYQDYLNRLNLYRQRVWTCKATGKTNLTYEEALVSERRASEKVQQIPKDLAAPILKEVQYSTLKLKDLLDSVSAKLSKRLFKGAEVFAQRGQSVSACRILEILEDKDITRFKVGWFDKSRQITSNSIVDSEALIRKKLPFSRGTLKSFIREMTSRSCPWVVYEDIATKHGISCEAPAELRDRLSVFKGQRWKNVDQKKKGLKRKRSENEEEDWEEQRYPIEDLLVRAGSDDPVFTERPNPCREFGVPMDCVGDLLMVWDFCSSFCRLLRLWPFSLEDFAKSISHTDSDLVLLAESHISLLRVIMQDEGEFFDSLQSKKRKAKITQSNWTELLCDFIEMVDISELSEHGGTIKRGHYRLLDPWAKLAILNELVWEALSTNAVRDKLDEYIEQQRELAVGKREKLRKLAAEEQTLPLAAVNGSPAAENGAKQRRGKKEEDEKKAAEKQTGGEMEKRFIRTNALGKDRNHNRYWFFRRDGRLFVESADFKQWGYYASKQELDALVGSLNPKGEREMGLQRQLDKYYAKISSGLQRRAKDEAQKVLLDEAVLRRSTRVRAPPRDSPAMAFLRYSNKWRED
ncbi:DDT domain-containing protein [Wolffia australiana]